MVPAHFDAEVFLALGRLVRGGNVAERLVEPMLAELARAPFVRYTLQPLLATAWGLRHNLSLRDALYVALARQLGAAIVTADARLAQAGPRSRGRGESRREPRANDLTLTQMT
jgi:predicted nucleic acid-binding protein